MNVGCIVVTFALGKVDWQEFLLRLMRGGVTCVAPPQGLLGQGHGKVDRSEESEESEESVKTRE